MKDSFLKTVWNDLLTLILLNLAFLICSVPVLTTPAALAGLYRGVVCCLGGKDHILSEYWKSFRENLFSALPVGLLFGALLAAAAYGCVFYRLNYSGQFLLLPVSIFCMIALYLCHTAMIYAFTMLATVELPRNKLIKNAFLLLPVDARALFTWPALSAAVILLSVLLFPRSLALLLLLSFSMAAILGARGAMPLIKRYITEDSNE